jgi:hypothetical protein
MDVAKAAKHDCSGNLQRFTQPVDGAVLAGDTWARPAASSIGTDTSDAPELNSPV